MCSVPPLITHCVLLFLPCPPSLQLLGEDPSRFEDDEEEEEEQKEEEQLQQEQAAAVEVQQQQAGSNASGHPNGC